MARVKPPMGSNNVFPDLVHQQDQGAENDRISGRICVFEISFKQVHSILLQILVILKLTHANIRQDFEPIVGA